MRLIYDKQQVKRSVPSGNYVTANDLVTAVPCHQVMVSGSSDLSALEEYPPTTIAYTAGYANIWQKGIDGEWVAIGEE